ncbi:hypothetical protein [Rhodoferax sp.]|nr:hypothetical protein [Rhodoferax sp.]
MFDSIFWVTERRHHEWWLGRVVLLRALRPESAQRTAETENAR